MSAPFYQLLLTNGIWGLLLDPTILDNFWSTLPSPFWGWFIRELEVGSTVLCWFTSFLQGWSQSTSIGSERPSSWLLLCGVPQGWRDLGGLLVQPPAAVMLNAQASSPQYGLVWCALTRQRHQVTEGTRETYYSVFLVIQGHIKQQATIPSCSGFFFSLTRFNSVKWCMWSMTHFFFPAISQLENSSWVETWESHALSVLY